MLSSATQWTRPARRALLRPAAVPYTTAAYAAGPKDRTDTALVLGSGIAGLATCQVLRKHFKKVTLVERDSVADPGVAAGPRKGVPQGRHLHALLSGGREYLDELFPGFSRRAMAAGALPFNSASDLLWVVAGVEKPLIKGLAHLDTLAATRPLYEACARRDLLAAAAADGRGALEVMPDAVATGLILDGGRVRGARVSTAGGAAAEVAADLVADCTGRASEAPKWLDLKPPERVVNSFLGYATQMFQPPSDWDPSEWKGLYVTVRAPEVPRGAAILAAEGGQWTVTMIGAMRNYPPTDRAGFLEFSRTLAAPHVHERIRRATPVGEAYAYRRTANVWRRWDALPGLPAGLVFVGDSTCAFNPAYGQGMTAALLSARCLDQALASRPVAPSGSSPRVRASPL